MSVVALSHARTYNTHTHTHTMSVQLNDRIIRTNQICMSTFILKFFRFFFIQFNSIEIANKSQENSRGTNFFLFIQTCMESILQIVTSLINHSNDEHIVHICRMSSSVHQPNEFEVA